MDRRSMPGSGQADLDARPHHVVGWHSETEPVVREAGEDVEVDVEDLLAGRLAIREKEVDALALESRAAQAACGPASRSPYARRGEAPPGRGRAARANAPTAAEPASAVDASRATYLSALVRLSTLRRI